MEFLPPIFSFLYIYLFTFWSFNVVFLSFVTLQSLSPFTFITVKRTAKIFLRNSPFVFLRRKKIIQTQTFSLKTLTFTNLSKMAPTPAVCALFLWTWRPVANNIPSFTAIERCEKEAIRSSFHPSNRGQKHKSTLITEQTNKGNWQHVYLDLFVCMW